MNPAQHKIKTSDEIADLIKGSHPHLKKKIRAALILIAKNPDIGKSLRDELAGLKSYRVSTFRIIYRVSFQNFIELIAIGPRKIIYEETYRLIKKESKRE
jgi:mRNA-degrading endonuclease RelE of RelBE toxin-antitoxin system